MPSERLIERSFSHAAVLADYKINGRKLRQTFSNIRGQPNNAAIGGTNRYLTERLLKQPNVLQQKFTKNCYVQPTKNRGGRVALLASKEYQLTTIKTSASNDIQVLAANCLSKN